MPLPALTLPGGFPNFAAGTHQTEVDSIYVPVPRQTGGDRLRRVWVSAPRVVQADLELSQAQLEQFFAWYEGPLAKGAVPFAAEVAKVGPGTEWWEAFLLSYTSQHNEGNLHTVSLRLHLVGEPSDTGPDDDLMTSEVLVALLFTAAESDPMALRSEVTVALDFTMTVNESMTAEVRVGLQFDAAGASPSYQLMDSEVEVVLDFIDASESPLMASEILAGLTFEVVPDGLMATEVAVSLAFVEEVVGYVASPGSFSATGSSSALIQVLSDGSIRSKEDFDGYVTEALWYTPVTSGVGSSLWVRATLDLGDTPAGSAVGSWLSLAASPRTWEMLAVGEADLTVEIAEDPDGLLVVSTFTAHIEVA